MVTNRILGFGIAAALIALSGLVASADGSGDPKQVKKDGGHYFDAEGNPTYNIGEGGMIDWAAYSGFRRYHSECHVCHGPEGEGSTYAPALKESLKTMSYNDFVAVVTNGRKNVTSSQTNVMPSFADNINVMCYLDDIFVYVRGRANEAIPRGRPPGREDKDPAITKAENACLGVK